MATEREIVRKKRAEVAAQIEDLKRRLVIYDDLLSCFGSEGRSTTNGTMVPAASIEQAASDDEPKNFLEVVMRVGEANRGPWLKSSQIAELVIKMFPVYAEKENLTTLVSNTLTRSIKKKRSWLEAEREGKNWLYRFRAARGNDAP
ncbi:MAG: hypothetical protein PHU25_15915 [Deltaproteobacteria bacterium]|nr:hypothetical protein [Deltaproteobacteria bacterium]